MYTVIVRPSTWVGFLISINNSYYNIYLDSSGSTAALFCFSYQYLCQPLQWRQHTKAWVHTTWCRARYSFPFWTNWAIHTDGVSLLVQFLIPWIYDVDRAPIKDEWSIQVELVCLYKLPRLVCTHSTEAQQQYGNCCWAGFPDSVLVHKSSHWPFFARVAYLFAHRDISKWKCVGIICTQLLKLWKLLAFCLLSFWKTYWDT